ncbi:MAG TPA: TetR/AcrR family transcriptional regulator [Hymenobacter sp.]|jgi:AcrR family transcriptional regulator|uniref:TetR/AcrR family transcriptional regulator n=1 Tax=Hymenobacter sp. TaxID=1898978 RepID=UPI002ED9EAD5
MNQTIRPTLNGHLYLRDPQGTELGHRILAESVRLIDEVGFEQFTFKKLAAVLASTEASIYRYFENKHRLLVYLVSWHWTWLRFQLRFHTHNVPDPIQRLRLALGVLCRAHLDDPATAGLDEAALYRIVMAEASKAFLTKEVDADNQAGLFQEYKLLAAELVALVLEINPHYPYPKALVSTLLESARKQLFFAQHLPSLSDGSGNVAAFLEHLALAALA